MLRRVAALLGRVAALLLGVSALHGLAISHRLAIRHAHRHPGGTDPSGNASPRLSQQARVSVRGDVHGFAKRPNPVEDGEDQREQTAQDAHAGALPERTGETDCVHQHECPGDEACHVYNHRRKTCEGNLDRSIPRLDCRADGFHQLWVDDDSADEPKYEGQNDVQDGKSLCFATSASPSSMMNRWV